MPIRKNLNHTTAGSTRVLFVTHGCYLDDSNGATVASRSMMSILGANGFGVEALTGTILELIQDIKLEAWLTGRGIPFEVRGGGAFSLHARGLRVENPHHYRMTINGVSLTLHRSPTTRPHSPTGPESDEFLSLFEAKMDRFRPDVLVTFGGDTLAQEIRSRAQRRNVPVVFALHNFNYKSAHTFATADHVIVPSCFAAEYYRAALGLDCKVLPYLVDPDRVRAEPRDPRYATFVTPSYEKGVFAFARIADVLGRRRPDIPLLVVEGRGNERTLADCGIDLRAHGNVFLMENTPDPRDFWAVTRLCLTPSLWLENQPLVAVEAMVNGIPVIGSDRGGIPETLGEAGIVLALPERITLATRMLPTAEEVEPWIEAVIRLWDDAEFYEEHRLRALTEARRWNPEILVPQYLDFFRDLKPGPKL